MTMTDRPTLESTLVADYDELDSLAISSPPGRAMAQPTSSRLSDTDIAAVLAAYSLCVVGMWSVHGGMTKLTQGWGPAWASVTSLTGLLTSAVALVALILVGRPLSLERRFGLDRMFIWHRMLGDSMGMLLGLHVLAGTIAWASDSGWINAVIDLTGRTPYMALAFVSALLIGIVTISSLKSIRQKLAYETWYFVHLLAYLAMGLSFGHEIFLEQT